MTYSVIKNLTCPLGSQPWMGDGSEKIKLPCVEILAHTERPHVVRINLEPSTMVHPTGAPDSPSAASEHNTRKTWNFYLEILADNPCALTFHNEQHPPLCLELGKNRLLMTLRMDICTKCYGITEAASRRSSSFPLCVVRQTGHFHQCWFFELN